MRGADAGACVQDGFTPVNTAAYNGQLDAVKLLLETEGGASTLGVKDKVSAWDMCVLEGERQRERGVD